jgi:serine/threonine-protein kinase
MAPEHGPREGARLAERYDVLRSIGRGGMGSVYEVHDTLLGETVALKVLDGSATLRRKARSGL